MIYITDIKGKNIILHQIISKVKSEMGTIMGTNFQREISCNFEGEANQSNLHYIIMCVHADILENE